MKRLRGLFCFWMGVFIFTLSSALEAQQPQWGPELTLEQRLEGLRNYLETKEKDRRKSDEYSEDEIKKMQQLGQIPLVKKVIQEAYADLQRSDQQEAFRINVETGRNALRLYQHPVLQEYINNLGQSLVPQDSFKLFTFRVLYDPLPYSFALSTGSVYVSTGMLSLVENEAQLAYVLSHEIAHVEREHFYQQIRGKILEFALNIKKAKGAAKKGAIFGAIAGVVTGLATGDAGYGFVGGEQAFRLATSIAYKPKATNWELEDEIDADSYGIELALKRDYDVREAPQFLLAMERVIDEDPRVGLAFHRNIVSLPDRRRHITGHLQEELKEELAAKEALALKGTSPNFHFLMATVRRDNGKRALMYDLFRLAKENLEKAIAIRSTDPEAHYYLGKVYALTSREPQDLEKAQHHFQQAISYDSRRNYHPEPHLELALALIRTEDPQHHPRIQKELKSYVRLYQRKYGGDLPASMTFIYDYLSLTGEDSWMVPAVRNVSLGDDQPLRVISVPHSQRERKARSNKSEGH